MKFCNKCQRETERYKCGDCKPCTKARANAWYAANPEIYKATKAAYRAANPEKVRARSTAARKKVDPEKARASSAAYRAANPEKYKAASAAWKKANPERCKAMDAAWAAANPERKKAKDAAWVAAHPEVCRIRNHNRRALKREAGKLSKGLSEKLFKLQRGKCACCGKPLGKNFHLDHIMPLALGGTNTDDNMQLLRQRCNNQKWAKDPLLFMQSRGFLL